MPARVRVCVWGGGGDDGAKVCKTQRPLRAEKKLTAATIKAAIIVSKNNKALDVYHNM